jgi:hypothetical protein
MVAARPGEVVRKLQGAVGRQEILIEANRGVVIDIHTQDPMGDPKTGVLENRVKRVRRAIEISEFAGADNRERRLADAEDELVGEVRREDVGFVYGYKVALVIIVVLKVGEHASLRVGRSVLTGVGHEDAVLVGDAGVKARVDVVVGEGVVLGSDEIRLIAGRVWHVGQGIQRKDRRRGRVNERRTVRLRREVNTIARDGHLHAVALGVVGCGVWVIELKLRAGVSGKKFAEIAGTLRR